MKTLSSIPSIHICLLATVVALGSLRGNPAKSFRTDINPALLYYQAFLVAPDPPLSSEDLTYLFSGEGRSKKLPERFDSLFASYDEQFRLVRQAGHAAVPCNWGIDLTEGPGTWLPQLARAKAVAQAANFRVRWELEHGRQAEARDDLLAAVALGRNLSRDGLLISTLVQFAIEAIDCNRVAESFGEFAPETLEQIVQGLDAIPRGTLAAAIPTEKAMGRDWLLGKIAELREQYPSDDAKVMAGLSKLILGTFVDPDKDTQSLWKRVSQAAGGTSDGVMRMLRERDQIYDRCAQVLALPYSEFERQMRQLVSSVKDNPMVSSSIAAFGKARRREFRVRACLEMIRAAAAYKLHGEAGLKSVMDPCGNGPFASSRFVFQGVDRGFELRSAYDMEGEKAALIFVEKAGPAFRVDGPHIGEPAP